MVIQGIAKMAGNSHHATVWRSVFETEGEWPIFEVSFSL